MKLIPGFLANAFQRKSAGGVYERWLQLLELGTKSKAGPNINLRQAFRVAAAFACMAKISRGVAQVPFKLYQETTEGGLTSINPARKHPLYDLLASKPNPWSTSFEFRETFTLHALMGKAYAFKNVVRGDLVELIVLDPGRVQATQAADWTPVYKVTGRDGSTQTFTQDQIWHLRGPSWDGFQGMDMLDVMREALGLSVALEDSASTLHANGVRPTGVYTIDGTLDETQHEKIVGWLKKNAGVQGTGLPLVLDRSAKWLQQTMTSMDAQHLEMRQFELTEVCRFFDVMPIMVGYSDKAATYASAEQMFLQHVVHTLMPWYVRIEQSADVNLLTDKERSQGYYFRFNASGLLRGALKDRGDYLAKALGAGGGPAWMTQDEVRALEELNPMGGDAAKLPPRSGGTPPTDPAPA